jgi:hypothetical protein
MSEYPSWKAILTQVFPTLPYASLTDTDAAVSVYILWMPQIPFFGGVGDRESRVWLYIPGWLQIHHPLASAFSFWYGSQVYI